MRDPDFAWAAGLFDAEGSVYTWLQAVGRAGQQRVQRQMDMSQSSEAGVPEVLTRFREVIGRGHLRGPVRGNLYYWYTARQTEIDQISTWLWPWLTGDKREQFRCAAEATGRESPRAAVERSSRASDAAWAAGFFEGEGTVRARGKRAEIAVPQATRDGRTPEALLRFQSTMGGVGWIGGPFSPSNPWSKLPQFVWGTARLEHVQHVIGALWPWLSDRRRNEALGALGPNLRVPERSA